MNQQEYIIRQFSRTNKKNYENYVVTRVYHRLNRMDVKFVTQQYVHRPDGHALTDMYFPQLQLHLEVDEPFHTKQTYHDLNRQTDIIQATGHEIHRIKITNDLEILDADIENFIQKIAAKISAQEAANTWVPWDLERELTPHYYRQKGYLDRNEHPTFRKITDACNTLGQNYAGNVQGGWFKSKVYQDHALWFPKFYENDTWDNKISDDGKTIFERCKNKKLYEPWAAGFAKYTYLKRITFPRQIDNLGFRMYKFVGVFETDLEQLSFENGIFHRLVEERIELVGE